MKNRNKSNISSLPFHVSGIALLIAGLTLFHCSSSLTPDTQSYTRGIGMYPGDALENFSPEMRLDEKTYRNLAFRRPAYQSSSYDYNQTAHLITDGILDSYPQRWMKVSTNQQSELTGNERFINFDTADGWLQYEFGGGGSVLEIDRIDIMAMIRPTGGIRTEWSMIVLGSNDGSSWKELGRKSGVEEASQPGAQGNRSRRRGGFVQSVELSAPVHYRFYRIDLNAENEGSWFVGMTNFFRNNEQLSFGGPQNFTSAWMSNGGEEEWVYIDLGAVCTFDRIVLKWINRAAGGSIQISDDEVDWRDIAVLPSGSGLTDDIKLDRAVNGRYVRTLMTQSASNDNYILSEMEIYGRGGPIVIPHPAPEIREDGRLDLAGGNWRIQRESLVTDDGVNLSQTSFEDEDWVVATVPGTVLVSYLNAGAIPDPNFGNNQLLISDSFFYADFWYRNEFMAPKSYEGKRTYLNFDGINWKAEVFLNGRDIGMIEGGFIRGKFDVTDLLVPGQMNALVVRIIKNATPGNIKEKTFQDTGSNGGPLGADNPTYHASIGWDWIPTIRGRNTGIWNDVFLTSSGPVTLENPFVTADLPLPDISSADVAVEVSVRNNTQSAVSGILRGSFGDIRFEQPVSLAASETKSVKLNPSTHASLRVQNPKLWWPVGYGNPDLYEVTLEFVTQDNTVSDAKSFLTGIREMAHSEEDGKLRLWINGRRFIPRGGNWGFPESMLLYRGREYDIAVRYHSDMNFTMIRNWVGMTGDDEFYEACDRHGVMIWQDFWLANPVDGPVPDNNEMFLNNAEDTVKRIRNHPSIALYCGRNEGYPPEEIDTGIRNMLPKLHPGIHYISSSADDVVSGHGPYRAMPTEHYFAERATPLLHSEMGMPNIVNYESLQLMMSESAFWPQGRTWGLHDFTLRGAQTGQTFIDRIEAGFGPVNNAKDWVTLAQWINYEGYRAMYEAQSKYRMGLLIWMSHPCWPTFVWQTYDYYFEPTAGYFGAKKGSEPLHIQWNAYSDSIEVVNYNAGCNSGLTANVEVLNMDGSVQWEKSATLDSPEDSMVPVFAMEYPENLSSVYFIRLKLKKGSDNLSENFYWRGIEEGNFKALNELPDVELKTATAIERDGDIWRLTTQLSNPSDYPALMIRLKVIREKSKDRILPVMYNDNYIPLMPGEQRTITMELKNTDTRGEKPQVVCEGFNTVNSF